jgi:hypothetical protein
LKPGVVADVCQASRLDNPFDNPRGVHVNQRARFSMLEKKDGITDVLADGRNLGKFALG